jgi:hypothetical protein
MSDIFNLVEGAGAYYPQDYTLKALNILTTAGQRFEMKKLMVELSYYEDLYSFIFYQIYISTYGTEQEKRGFFTYKMEKS